MKIFGCSLYPFHLVCGRRNVALQTSTSSCLRRNILLIIVFVLDMTRVAAKFMAFDKMHVFALLQIITIVLWALDEASRVLT
jgi:hypothetical protein